MRIILTFIFTLCSFAAIAQEQKVYSIKEIEDYLSSLKNYQASFDQVVPAEDFAQGTLYIKKPGKFLWQYETPAKYKIASNGGFAYFIDQEGGQTTQIPSAGILFSLLSNEKISLNNDYLEVTSIEQNENRITLNLKTSVADSQVPVTLIFQKLRKEQKLSLMKIISQNQLEQPIVISLYNQEENAKLDKSIFKIEVEENNAL